MVEVAGDRLAVKQRQDSDTRLEMVRLIRVMGMTI
jgi:hypothetical protein